MFRLVLIGVVALLASASAFLAPVPGLSMLRTPRACAASLEMVSTPSVSTPSVTSTAGEMKSSESSYTEALKKMEADCMKDLEQAFDETAKKAKAESDKIWTELNAEFADEDP